MDYRASFFPVALFNGHLTASNSDVRAGNNYDKHLNRWTGFQNWWQGFFGVRLERRPTSAGRQSRTSLSTVPRIGKKNIDVMAADFLKAWLVEGNAIAAWPTSRIARLRAWRRTATIRSSSIAAWRRFSC